MIILDELVELAGMYHGEKVEKKLNYPLEYINSENGRIRTDSFDYFPEHHYEKGFEKLRGKVNDRSLNEWIERVIGSTPTGATHGGLWKENVPEMVEHILNSDRRYETEIIIQPESVPEGYDYLVEWKYIDFDRHEMEWKPLKELYEDGR